MLRIGIIGYGARMSGYWRSDKVSEGVIDCLLDWEMDVAIAAITDVNIDKVKHVLGVKKIDVKNIAFYTNADDMLDNEQLDGVLIGTNCSTHAEMAIKVLKRNLPLFLEKPVATNMDSLKSLMDAYRQSQSDVVVSFPLKAAPLVKLAKQIISSGQLGTIEHVQAASAIPYGGVYFHSWYRDSAETGGMFLQKATHDFDYINYLVDMRPVEVCAVTSRQIFKGNKPATLMCKDCDENETCPESPFVMKHIKKENVFVLGDMCCFSEISGNEDSGSSIIRYESGMHLSYSHNFFARKEAAARGARLFGYKGTLDIDWFKDEIKVYMHDTPRVERFHVDTSQMSHAGGDEALAYNFIRVMQGKERTISPLEDGLLSALMCLKAKQSAETKSFQAIALD